MTDEEFEDTEYVVYDEPEQHLGFNPYTDRFETGGDEIEFADESDYLE